MKTVVRALWRWSWLLVLGLLAGYFGGKEVAALFPPTYQATALVQLNAQAHPSQVIQPIPAYATLVTSDSVLSDVLKRYPLDRTTFVTKQLTVTPDTTSETISIQVTLPNAKMSAGVANLLAQKLVTQQNAYIQSQYNKELQIIKDRISNDQKTLDQLNQAYDKAAQANPPNTTTLQQLNSQISQQENLQNQDLSQQQALETEQALDNTPLSIVQSALVPHKPSSIVGLIPLHLVVVVVAFFLGLVAIGILEQSAGRINGVYALQKRAASSILGSLRWTSPSPQKVPIGNFCVSQTPYAEECRVMMADVLFHAEQSDAHILAITSIKARSGSSTIAAQLAALLAQSKRRVLLIDANLYAPSLHKRLGIANGVGVGGMLGELRSMRIIPPKQVKAPVEAPGQFAIPQSAAGVPKQATVRIFHPRFMNNVSSQHGYNWLAPDPAAVNGMNAQHYAPVNSLSADGLTDQGDVEFGRGFPFDRYIVPTSIENLYVLPAGKSAMNPSSLLSVPEMGYFLKWASRPIDFIVVDCPSVAYAESRVLGSLSDQTLLVVDATRDRLKQVLNAEDELLSTGVKLSGLIVNKLGRWI